MTANNTPLRISSQLDFSQSTRFRSQLPIVEVKMQNHPASKGNLLLWHGLLTDFSFWINAKGRGLAAYLARQGYRVLIPEWQQLNKTQAQLIDQDLVPLLQQLLISQQPLQMIAHSYGGLLAVASLQRLYAKDLASKPLNSLSLLAVQDSYLDPVFVAAIQQSLVTQQPLPEILQVSGYANHQQTLLDYLASYQSLTKQADVEFSIKLQRPLQALSGAADRTDPPEYCAQYARQVAAENHDYQCLSLEQGFQQDYNHTSLLLGRSAQQEIWPRLLAWLDGCHATL